MQWVGGLCSYRLNAPIPPQSPPPTPGRGNERIMIDQCKAPSLSLSSSKSSREVENARTAIRSRRDCCVSGPRVCVMCVVVVGGFEFQEVDVGWWFWIFGAGIVLLVRLLGYAKTLSPRRIEQSRQLSSETFRTRRNSGGGG